ncbi:hypothetical protein KDW54_06810 [Burkholderia ambifaria]|uniref:hypothetical protein n=1 Tax=Burkholderia ambifaria TaxID=152480 RepID=UPI001B8F9B18|nr:hypothetical protein [Burkholderia ambifaria]MBR8182108.1 hypothetical protein [Burkholderia ambifaria]
MPSRKERFYEIPIFPIPIFGGKLALCLTPAEWESLAAEYGDESGVESCKGLAMRYYSEVGGRLYAIGVFDGTADTFIHELAHATFFVLGDVGVPIENGGDNEAFAYTIGWLVREAMPIFLERTGSKP